MCRVSPRPENSRGKLNCGRAGIRLRRLLPRRPFSRLTGNSLMAPDLISNPTSRKPRIFAFDPSVSSPIATAGIGEITISVPWETDLQPGPVGEYIEVVDADPASGAVYRPVDLN